MAYEFLLMIKLISLPIIFQLKYVLHRDDLVAKLLLSFLKSWEFLLNICCSFSVRLNSRSLRFPLEHKLPYAIFRGDECSLIICGKDVSPKHSLSWTLKIKVERLRVEICRTWHPYSHFFSSQWYWQGSIQISFLCVSLIWKCPLCGALWSHSSGLS